MRPVACSTARSPDGFVVWVHCHIGHTEPADLQDIVEMDDVHDANTDSAASDRFINDGKPAYVRAVAEELVSGSE